MQGIYQNYEVILLDSAFFTAEFSKEEQESLGQTPIFTAPSFTIEVEQYTKLLTEKQQQIYHSNLDFIEKNVKTVIIGEDCPCLQAEPFRKEFPQAESLQPESWKIKSRNLWGILQDLEEYEIRLVVITANQLLIQRIVLEGLKSDIYDLNRNQLLCHTSFTEWKARYEYAETSLGVSTYNHQEWNKSYDGDPLEDKINSNRDGYAEIDSYALLSEIYDLSEIPESSERSEDTTLFRKNQPILRLGTLLKTGAEASLYHVEGDTKAVIKIFRKNQCSSEKLGNIEKLIRMKPFPDLPWVAFPEEIVYYDEACTVPAGFTEKFIPSKENLEDNPLFWGDFGNIPRHYLLRSTSDLIDLCIKVVRQVCYLNVFGFYLSDFTLSNFSVLKENHPYIQMWDTDSFGYGSYWEKYFSPDYVPYIPIYEAGSLSKSRVIQACNDALFQFVFRILSLGDGPVAAESRMFKYEDPDNYYRKSFIPDNIWECIFDFYHGNQKMSAEELLYQLVLAKNQITDGKIREERLEEMISHAIPGFRKYARSMQRKQFASCFLCNLQKLRGAILSYTETKKRQTYLILITVAILSGIGIAFFLDMTGIIEKLSFYFRSLLCLSFIIRGSE